MLADGPTTGTCRRPTDSRSRRGRRSGLTGRAKGWYVKAYREHAPKLTSIVVCGLLTAWPSTALSG